MKIAFIYDAIYPWIKGGAEKRIYEIAKRLAKKHEVHWFGVGWWFKDNGKSDVIERDGIVLHGVCKPVQLYVNGRRSISEALYFAWKLFPKLIKEEFDVIDCQEFPYFPCFSAKVHSLLRRTPLVITWLEVWDSYWKDYLGYVKGLVGQIVERIVSRLPDGIITISKMVMNDLVSLLNVKIDQTKIAIVPDGIDFFKIQDVKPLEDTEYDVIYAGRLIDHKNVDVLIKAIKILKNEISDIRCCIIGDGPEKKNLQLLAHNLGLDKNIEFVGFLERDVDVYSYMKSSKVFVLPSTREGAGLVTLEANACGLPAITVRHEKNAAIEVIEEGRNGFICELTPISLAESIKIALENANSMKKDCIEFARRYDWCEISKSTEKFYSKLIQFGVCKP